MTTKMLTPEQFYLLDRIEKALRLADNAAVVYALESARHYVQTGKVLL